MNKLDKKIIQITERHLRLTEECPECVKIISEIKQVVLKEIERVRPDNQDNVHYNEALDDYDNRIFNLLTDTDINLK